MPLRETPTGLVQTGGTKTFMQIQTENAAKLAAGTVTSVTCGVEATPSVSSLSPELAKKAPKPSTTEK